MKILFLFSLLTLIYVYLYIPQLSFFIRYLGVLIILFRLAAVFTNQIQHSSFLPKRTVQTKRRLVLVTGCDSGFGLETAKRLDCYGFHVLAGVLSTESNGCKYLTECGSNRLRTFKLDVTKQEDVNKVVKLIAHLTNYKQVSKKKDDLQFWALINNAGVAQFSPIEFGNLETDLRPMIEVNVFGVLRMTKAMLPFLRVSKGRIINIGSICGRMTIGGLTGYSMSKHAIRSLTDGLRQEMEMFDVKAILIEPTLYKTPISNIDSLIYKFNESFDRTHPLIKSDYGNQTYREEFTKHLRKMIILSRSNIDEVISSIMDAVINQTPKEQYWCASSLQKILYWFIEQSSIHFTDKLCTWKPPQKFINLVEKINNLS